MITPKQRVLAVLHGRAIDRFPVVAPYLFLTQCDHWCEITGQPAWTFYEWLIQEPSEHVRMYDVFYRLLPFDMMQPWPGPTREERENLEVVHQGERHFYRDRRTGELTPLNEDLHQREGPANQIRRIYDRDDVQRLVPRRSAQEILASGVYDHIQEARRAFPDSFLMNGVVGTFWQCTAWVGETNLFSLLYDAPELIHYLSARLLENTIEDIRALAAAGEDAIYIDDALTTNDMISVDFYERFSMPYVKPMVDEIHALGKVAVLIYFGGVADRIPQILSLGADALNVETSMKSYVNDLAEISAQVGDKMCLWGNIDPIGVLQNGTEEELRRAIAEQVEIGRRTGRHMISTGSPITPLTPLPRIRRFIELGQELGRIQTTTL